MQPESREGVTRLLQAVAQGSEYAKKKLLAVAYHELHNLAHHKMKREPAGHTLQTTALVNEAYLRLFEDGAPIFENRVHFFGAAAQAMRRILVDRARYYGRRKHGSNRKRLDPEVLKNVLTWDSSPLEVLALDEALTLLHRDYPSPYDVVMLRFFCGRNGDETAELLGLSLATVGRHWKFAKVWLYKRIEERNPVSYDDLTRQN